VRESLAAESGTIGTPALNIAIFGVFVLITLVITFRASRTNKSAAA
jgi:cation/acetate symporter